MGDPRWELRVEDFVSRLVPVCGSPLAAARADIGPSNDKAALDGYTLLKGVGNLCISAASDTVYNADRLVQALISEALTPTHHGSKAPVAHRPPDGRGITKLTTRRPWLCRPTSGAAKVASFHFRSRCDPT